METKRPSKQESHAPAKLGGSRFIDLHNQVGSKTGMC